MIRIQLRLRYREGIPRPLPILLVLLLLIGTLGTSQPSLAVVRPAPGQASQVEVARRGFYLTELDYDADQALSACAEDYHMASLWEILDVSNLAYAYDHPDAHTKDDSGRGPPSHWYGWLRTGWNSSGTDTAGVGNCQNWTSITSGDRGSIGRLTYDWATAPTAVGPWETLAWDCSGIAPVWCVQDADRIRQIFLPLVLRN